ncbi:MAG TPA: serine/threonine-protein kinase [Tepidisphaeraceae bacterium]|jgi:serine/threonine protein kinase|nr:serine/threonine-protein kinase [Tepidisphaeraceae bacterium]
MNTCTRCGTSIASDLPQGLCARCLLSQAMDAAAVTAGDPRPQTAAGQPNSQAIDITDIAEVARRLPQFEIIELLGRGGMGVVYKARQMHLDRLVALKILLPADAISPGFVERFRREARSLAKLNHPHIVTVHEFGEAGGLYYLAMEYVDGVNLRQMIVANRMTAAEALALVPGICEALQYAHEEGVVHRDIKPENILVDKRGRVKIADFGLAKLLGRAEADPRLTATGTSLGTPRYMAPEQVDKPDSVDHRADIYSLGVVFYEMLTGELPVGRFPVPSQKIQIDVRLDEIVLHALERDVARRYQQISEVRLDLENVTSKPPADPAEVSERVRRARASWLGRRSSAFRTALPYALFVGAVIALALAAVPGLSDTGTVSKTTFGMPSPWLVITVLRQHSAVVGQLAGFHPLTISFGCVVAFVVLIGLAQYCMSIGTIVQFGRRRRDLRPEIRRSVRRRIIAGALAAIVIPMLLSAPLAIIPGVSHSTQEVQQKLLPESRAYDWVALQTTFVTENRMGMTADRRPHEWNLSILLKPKNQAEVSTMDIQMPSLLADCDMHQSMGAADYHHQVVLDSVELNGWMQNQLRLEKPDPKMQKENAELMAMLKQFVKHPPANFDELLLMREEQCPSLGFFGFNAGTSFSIAADSVLPIYLSTAALFLVLFMLFARRTVIEAFALDQAVRQRGLRVLARTPLPRASFMDLPAELRLRVVWQCAFAAGLLLLAPIGAALWQNSQPEIVRHHLTYDFNATSPAIHKLTMACTFDSYSHDGRDGDTYLVEPRPLVLDLLFALKDGTTQKLTVQLPGLSATAYGKDGINAVNTFTLDAEELERWMSSRFPASGDPAQQALDASDLTTFLKRYSTQAPTTPDVLGGESHKLKRFQSYEAQGAGTEGGFDYSSHRGYLPAVVFVAVLPLFFLLALLLKRAAIRTAIQRGFSIPSGARQPTTDTRSSANPVGSFRLVPRHDVLRWWLIGISAALFAFSFFLPAGYTSVNEPGLHVEGQSMSGLDAFRASFSIDLTSWAANPVLWGAWILLAFRQRWLAFAAGATAFGLAAAHLGIFQPHSAIHLQSGYYCWLGSFAVMMIGALWLAVRQWRVPSKSSN